MEKLDIQDTLDKGIEFKHGFFLRSKAIIDLAESLRIGESILISYHEWGQKSYPSSTPLNNYFKQNNLPNRMKMKSLNNGKEFCFIRYE